MNWIHAIIDFFCEILFGCRHDKLTRPFTLEKHTYKVCLDCGKQIFYSAERMSPLSAREVRHMRAAESGELNVVPLKARVRRLVAIKSNKSNAAA
jgi:hypothetical protein